MRVNAIYATTFLILFTATYTVIAVILFDPGNWKFLFILWIWMHMSNAALFINILNHHQKIVKKEKWRWVLYLLFIPVISSFHFFFLFKNDIKGIVEARKRKMHERTNSLKEFNRFKQTKN